MPSARGIGSPLSPTRGEGWREGTFRRSRPSLLLALLCACAHVGPAPEEALRAATAAQASAAELGLAALVQLDRGQADAAQELLRRAPGADEPTSLLAKLLFCKRNLDAPCQARAATRLLERFPQTPAAAIAAA